jgi:Family of unknown function (DUF6510)
MSADRHVDGNAMGGVLIEVFGREMTAVEGTCLDCGQVSQFGELVAYLSPHGQVLHCPGCSAVLLVVVVRPDGYEVTIESIQVQDL